MVDEVLQCKRTSKLQWTQANTEGIMLPFDGIPFMCVGTINYQGHQGDDVDKRTKNRRAEKRDKAGRTTVHYLDSKIVDCAQSRRYETARSQAKLLL